MHQEKNCPPGLRPGETQRQRLVTGLNVRQIRVHDYYYTDLSAPLRGRRSQKLLLV